eukprot:916932-Alexandrium_andersonii.AAC.1
MSCTVHDEQMRPVHRVQWVRCAVASPRLVDHDEQVEIVDVVRYHVDEPPLVDHEQIKLGPGIRYHVDGSRLADLDGQVEHEELVRLQPAEACLREGEEEAAHRGSPPRRRARRPAAALLGCPRQRRPG